MTKAKRSNLHTTMLGRHVELTDRNGEPFQGTVVNVYMAKDRGGRVAPHYSVEFLPGVNIATRFCGKFGWYNDSTNSRILEINLEDWRGDAHLVPCANIRPIESPKDK